MTQLTESKEVIKTAGLTPQSVKCPCSQCSQKATEQAAELTKPANVPERHLTRLQENTTYMEQCEFCQKPHLLVLTLYITVWQHS